MIRRIDVDAAAQGLVATHSDGAWSVADKRCQSDLGTTLERAFYLAVREAIEDFLPDAAHATQLRQLNQADASYA